MKTMNKSKYVGMPILLAAGMLTAVSCSDFDDYNKEVTDPVASASLTLWSMLMKEEFYNPKQQPDATTRINELNYLGSDRWAEAQNWDNNTDWVKAVKQFGAMHDYNVNLTGGGQKATFRISAGYKHQTGSIIKQKFQQFTSG